MKIISIIGYSNSGKTTLISKLMPILSKKYKAGTVKDMGHHVFELQNGKDTTIHFQSGAECSCGIDAEKSILTMRGTDLFKVLDLYDFMGYDYTVVEGFKQMGYPCAVLGDIESDNAILKNPTAEEVYEYRDKFSDYKPNLKHV